MRIRESEAAGAVHDRPFRHLVTAEDIALNVTQVHNQDAARGQKQEIDMKAGTHPVRDEHVDQMIGPGGGDRRTKRLACAVLPVPAPEPRTGEAEQRGACDEHPRGRRKILELVH